MALNNVATRPGTRVAAATAATLETGLRLCGIADEPPLPAAAGSNASPTSDCISNATSPPILPNVAASRPKAHPTSTMRSRAVCQGSAGNGNSRVLARACATSRPRSCNEARVPAAPPNCSTKASRRKACRRCCARCRASSQPATLSPKVTGTACCSRVRPGKPVLRSRSASTARSAHRACRRGSSRSSAARSCSTVPVSMTSWLVAPQCTQRAAALSCAATCAVSALTSGMAGLPASAVACANAARS